MYINAVETYLPGRRIGNEELGEIINFRPNLIEKLFRNHSRYFSTDIHTGELLEESYRLIVRVVEGLVESSGIAKEELDFIIVSTATPDLLLPTSLNQACHKLGIKNVETYQIIAGCSRGVQGLNMARYMLKSGLHKKGIVIGVE